MVTEFHNSEMDFPVVVELTDFPVVVELTDFPVEIGENPVAEFHNRFSCCGIGEIDGIGNFPVVLGNFLLWN